MPDNSGFFENRHWPSPGIPVFGQLALKLLLPMKLYLWVGIRALNHFLAPLARNLTGMVFKLRSTLASDDFAAF